ncbi:hypothetical protein KAI92_05270 [Candidatus Parcubacteria bacterium]|nr:hypothetical protein [Candidatus Parcubacteria bacterium]
MKKFIIIMLLICSSFVFVDSCIAKNVPICDPLTGTCGGAALSTHEIIGRVIKAILGLVGSLALLMFIYGGFMWMFSAGNKERVQKGKDVIIWATVGLIVIFTAYAAVRFVLKGLTGA